MDRRRRPSDVLRTNGATREEPIHNVPRVGNKRKPGEQWTPPSQPRSQRPRCKCNCKCHAPGPWFEEINQQLQEADSLGQAKKKQIRVLTDHRSSMQCRECCRASALDAEFFHIDTRTERRFTLGQGIYQHEIAIVRLQYKLPWTGPERRIAMGHWIHIQGVPTQPRPRQGCQDRFPEKALQITNGGSESIHDRSQRQPTLVLRHDNRRRPGGRSTSMGTLYI